jgi:hypothetical protein
MSIIDSQLATLLFHLLHDLLLLLLEYSPSVNISRLTLIDSWVCSINMSLWIHEHGVNMLGYINYWLLTGCFTSPSPTPAPIFPTPFQLLQNNSDSLVGMVYQFVWPSTLRQCKHTTVCQWLTIGWLLYFFSISTFISFSSWSANSL